MTIRLLEAWNGYPVNAIVSLDAATENALVNGIPARASFSLTGGFVWSPGSPYDTGSNELTWADVSTGSVTSPIGNVAIARVAASTRGTYTTPVSGGVLRSKAINSPAVPWSDESFSTNVRGAIVCDWTTGTSGTASTTDVFPEPRWPIPAVPQCNGAAAVYFAQAASGTESSDFAALVFRAKAMPRIDGQPYGYYRCDIGTDSTFANRGLAAFTLRCDGKWRWIVLPRAQWGTSGTFTMGTTTFSHVRMAEQGGASSLTLAAAVPAGATSATLSGAFGATTEVYPVRFSNNEVRMCQLTNGSTAVTWGTALTRSATTAAVYATTRIAAQTGDTAQFGTVYRNPFSRSLAVIRFDDSTADQYSPRLSLATAYVGQSGVTIPAGVPQSGLSLCQAFGLKANCFILTRHVGDAASNFMTVAQLRDLQDTYGWNICFQTHANPFSLNNLGLRLLGPLGFNLATNVYGSISSVVGNVVTTANIHQITQVLGQAGLQGYPVELIGPTLPASTLRVGQQVWLRNTSTTAFTIHLTELDSINNTNIVTLDVGGTSWGYRYWGSRADESAIVQDFANGQSLMQSWGLNGWRHYAFNQGAWDQLTEAAALSLISAGNLRIAQGTLGNTGAGSSSFIVRPTFGAQGAGIGFVGGGQIGATIGEWINGGPAISTEAVTETNIRAAVDAAIARGGFISNYHHFFTNETSMRQLIAYLDHLKLRQDQGMLQVVTCDELWALMQTSEAQ